MLSVLDRPGATSALEFSPRCVECQQYSMHVADLVRVMEAFAPPSIAEEWDNVGLILGSEQQPLRSGVLLTIDLTELVVQEAIAQHVGAIVAYHPPLFSAVKRITDGPGSSQSQRVALLALRAGVAVYSPHTALDACVGGITDWLADGLVDPEAAKKVVPGRIGFAGADRRAIRPLATRGGSDVKIVTFVPEDAAERVRNALATAGAGKIGHYEVCSFSAPGTGTFRGDASTKPTLGKAGELEAVREIRLEMVCARRALALALQTLRHFHPYEEPAIDVYGLEGKPDRTIGVGRRITLDHPVSLRELADRLKLHLGVPAVQIGAVGGSLDHRVSRIGLVPGAGASIAAAALADECEVFVTGEMKHHEVTSAIAGGLSVILGGHTNTERGYLPRLAAMLGQHLPGVRCTTSAADRDPLVLR